MSLFFDQNDDPRIGVIGSTIAICLVGIIVVIAVWMAGMPSYRIYRQNKQGEANLRQQEWEKKILIEQAKAQNESATLNAEARVKQAKAEAEAEIVRSKGVAEANKIIADSLQGNESYLRYLWIDKLSDKSVIYVPTEAGLPILEAGKR